MNNRSQTGSISFQDILNANDDAIFLLDAILMIAPQVSDSDQCNALQAVALTAKGHLKKLEELVEGKWKESKQ
ncbi:hypothetical protein F9K91_14865 [Brucella tritici]|uniref:Uncharacterized protein n=1 Tax=Brucella tritici TaxID=94626 RepID=A0A7X6FR45_9HYPH|nr:hypothetical protein [Brucella tritici]KAB2664182.1 hypothetical protein F9K91_14865 [Brucella tritici]MBJ6720495.1 hypothetical protein [Bacillus sp. PR5]NKW10354.1 hypothetical protein [Brucella tritici]